MKTPLKIAFLFVFVKIALHLATADNLGFHRDEFLYLALGRHLDWGYWSNPPWMGMVGWLAQHVGGGTVSGARLWPALAGGALVWITALMVREMGGGKFAQLAAGIGSLISIAWLRAFSMLMPVPFDILYWGLLSWMLLRWLNTRDDRWWTYIGIVAGLGMLNKYSLVFWAAALGAALLCTSQRNALLRRGPWLALGLGVLVMAPNLYWQWAHDFPVINHMQELRDTQLSKVDPVNFFTDQLIFHGGALLLWLPGLVWLFREKSSAFRLIGWHSVWVLALLLLSHGKSYYTLGIYPALFAAGAVYWEKTAQAWWSRALLCAGMTLMALPLIPTGIPLAKPDRLATYFRWLSQDVGVEAAVRWEQGNLEALPQDYADMLGWPQLAAAADTAVARAGGPAQCLVYAENYGQAGAVEHLGHLTVASFADSYRLWVPDTISPDIQHFVYINDELGEDVRALFDSIVPVGAITEPLARERGTTVYLCMRPKRTFATFWRERVQEVKKEGRR